MIAMRFLNASVLLRKALNRNLSWGFPLGNLLPKTRVLKHRVLERKRRPNANASVLGTQRFRTLSLGGPLGGRFSSSMLLVLLPLTVLPLNLSPTRTQLAFPILFSAVFSVSSFLPGLSASFLALRATKSDRADVHTWQEYGGQLTH